MKPKRQFDLLILGGGHAAGQLILSLAQHKYEGAVGLVTDEDVPPYQRPPLSKGFLTGDVPEDRLPLVSSKTWDRVNCDVFAGERAEHIDRAQKTVRLRSGRAFGYNALAICTGASPRRLPVPGADLGNVQYLRSLGDARAMLQRLEGAKNVVIVGGGYIGLEVAAGTRKLGGSVTVLERENRILPRVVAPEVSDFFHHLHEANGVEVLTGESVLAFQGDGKLNTVETASGRALRADLALIAVGIEPNVSLAQECGLATNDGIEVDEFCRTSDPSVYAAGDCTRYFSRLYDRHVRLESVQNATDQARLIAAAIAGRDAPPDAIPWFWSEQFDVRIQIAGLNQGYDRLITRGDPADKKLSYLYLKKNRLIACDAINSVGDFTGAKKLIASKSEVAADQLQDTSRPLKSFATAD